MKQSAPCPIIVGICWAAGATGVMLDRYGKAAAADRAAEAYRRLSLSDRI